MNDIQLWRCMWQYSALLKGEPSNCCWAGYRKHLSSWHHSLSFRLALQLWHSNSSILTTDAHTKSTSNSSSSSSSFSIEGVCHFLIIHFNEQCICGRAAINDNKYNSISFIMRMIHFAFTCLRPSIICILTESFGFFSLFQNCKMQELRRNERWCFFFCFVLPEKWTKLPFSVNDNAVSNDKRINSFEGVDLFCSTNRKISWQLKIENDFHSTQKCNK